MSDDPMVNALQGMTGLDEVAALRIRVASLQAANEFLQEQCTKGWRLYRAALRDMDALMGVECPLPHDGPCGRCGAA